MTSTRCPVGCATPPPSVPTRPPAPRTPAPISRRSPLRRCRGGDRLELCDDPIVGAQARELVEMEESGELPSLGIGLDSAPSPDGDLNLKLVPGRPSGRSGAWELGWFSADPSSSNHTPIRGIALMNRLDLPHWPAPAPTQMPGEDRDRGARSKSKSPFRVNYSGYFPLSSMLFSQAIGSCSTGGNAQRLISQGV